MEISTSLLISIGTLVATLATSYGVYKTKMAQHEKEINGMGMSLREQIKDVSARIDKELSNLKSDYINKMETHERESDKAYRDLIVDVSLLKERQNVLKDKVDKL